VNVETVDIGQVMNITTDEKLNKQRAVILEARSFIAVTCCYPLVVHNGLYITGGGHRVFGLTDGDGLFQVLAQTNPSLHNSKLVDQLGSNAAEADRRRIALALRNR
jgi:hypothetical protein